jgi:hypothetical protein
LLLLLRLLLPLVMLLLLPAAAGDAVVAAAAVAAGTAVCRCNVTLMELAAACVCTLVLTTWLRQRHLLHIGCNEQQRQRQQPR